MNDIHYYFLPVVRQGLAAAIAQGPTVDEPHRAHIDMLLRATARRKDGAEPDQAEITQPVNLYGPGDILGFHERIITRCHPERDVGDFEPNYFPSIEFTDADFAWRFTADKANAQTGMLTPWITLIALVSESQGDLQPEFKDGPRQDRNLPPHIIVSRSALPDLEQAWRWAHVHVTEESEKENELEQILHDEPEDAICRLLCARRLAPKVKYAAFVVPTFKLGVLAGLGYDLDPNVSALDLAWLGDDTDETLPYYVPTGSRDDLPLHLQEGVVLKLPYYYRWEFRTGLRGDFEHLVRLLEPRKLSGLGIRNIDCKFPGFGRQGVDRSGFNEPESHYLGMEGALQSVDTRYTPWGRDPANAPAQAAAPLQVELVDLLNKPKADQALPEFVHNEHPTSAIDYINVRLFAFGTAVRVRWHTTLPATSNVDYGQTTDYGVSIPAHYPDSGGDSPSRQDHVLTLVNLSPGATYHYKIFAETDDGMVLETPDCMFTMPPLPWVVPPIYGRWHRARDEVVAENQEQWLDVLNLDPRHRAAGGLGAEVVRKQQESLMASAWEQLGAIESANDVLRRAQFGRDTSIRLHGRLDNLLTEDFLRVTAPIQKRVLVDDPQSGKKMTASQYLRTQSRIPAAALAPAFRRIMRPRGPIRKRQSAGRSVDLLTRLASGEAQATELLDGSAPKPAGTTRLCDITHQLKENLKPTASLTANPPSVGVGEATTLTWSCTNATSCTASGIGWTGAKPCSGSEQVVPFPSDGSGPGIVTPGSGGTVAPSPGLGLGHDPGIPIVHYIIACSGPCGSESATVMVGRSNGTGEPSGDGGGTVTDDGGLGPVLGDGGTIVPGSGVVVTPPGRVRTPSSRIRKPYGLISEPSTTTAPVPLRTRFVPRTLIPSKIEDSISIMPGMAMPNSGVRFCDGFISCDLIKDTVSETNPFDGIQNAPDPQTMVPAVCNVINNWLDKQPDTGEPEKPIRPQNFVEDVRTTVFPALDPNKTVLERTKKRLRLAGDLAMRFEEGAIGDPLDTIMWAPEYPQPMYEPLRDISHDLLLPGVETIPQNTLGLLQTNRRFLESYMCGCNHGLAGELLWRDYPTDQRGSYFRQFWDVSEYVPRPDERDNSLSVWLHEAGERTGQAISTVGDVPRLEKERLVWRHDDLAIELILSIWGAANEGELQDAEQRRIIAGIQEGQRDVLSRISESDMNALVTELAIEERMKEKLRDINRLVKWQENVLGSNATRPGEDLVLVVRGDLLKRYPNALIYAIDAVPCDGADGEPVPGLAEYLKHSDGTPILSDPQIDDETKDQLINDILGETKRIFPVFKATLPPDLTFFGFPFSDEEARGVGGLGKYFVIEEQITEPRFGLDLPVEPIPSIQKWPDDLCWSHFGFGNQDDNYYYGCYLDAPPETNLTALENAGKKAEWIDASSAKRAWIACQKPVRIAVLASEMLPTVAAYFEFAGPGPDELFVIKLFDPEKIDHARNILNGTTSNRLHIKGRIVLEQATYNPGWSYHLDPNSIEFFDVATEVCDATMSYIEDHLGDLGDAFLPDCIWCPWGSELTRELTDVIG